VAAVLTVVLTLAACSSSVGPTEPSGAQTTSEIEYQLFRLANREREGNGARPELVLDQGLSAIARQYSELMRDQGFFSHVAPDGSTLKRRLEIAGIGYSSAGENIAQVTHAGDPAVLAHDLLMDSRRHRANILDSDYQEVGMGVARSRDTFWITQVFVSP
jgi:uncharacterized protein YkwD